MQFGRLFDIIDLLSALPQWEEVDNMEYLLSFIVSIVARVMGHLLCKRVDRHLSDK